MNLRKVMEFNTIKAKNDFKNNDYQKNSYSKTEEPNKNTNSRGKTTITVRSDDPRYFD